MDLHWHRREPRRPHYTSLVESDWLTSSKFLKTTLNSWKERQEKIPLNESDPEVCKEVIAFITKSSKRCGLRAERFSCFSSLYSLQHAIANLIVAVKEFKRRKNGAQKKQGPTTRKHKERNTSDEPHSKGTLASMTVIVCTVKRKFLGPDLSSMLYIGIEKAKVSRRENGEKKRALKGLPLYQPDPFVDSDGTVCVGGHLRQARLEYEENHPVLLPKSHYLVNLVVHHYYNQVHHQGCLITHKAIWQAGHWLIGGHRTVSKELNKCIVCKKLRGLFLVLDYCMAKTPFTLEEHGNSK